VKSGDQFFQPARIFSHRSLIPLAAHGDNFAQLSGNNRPNSQLWGCVLCIKLLPKHVTGEYQGDLQKLSGSSTKANVYSEFRGANFRT
jgi:hypothetical protein